MSLVARIYLSMGAMVALIVLVGSIASFRTSDLGNTFVEYRETAKSSLLAHDLSQNITDIRLAALSYRFTSDPSLLETVSRSVEVASGNAVELTQALGGQSELRQLPNLLEEYAASLLQVSQLRDRRNELVEMTANSGRAAREKTTEAMQEAINNNEAQAVSSVGFAVNNLLLGRLFLERFLVDNELANFDRSANEIASAKSGLDELVQATRDRQLQSTLESIIGNLDEFSAASSELKGVVQERNALYVQMDEIGPRSLDLVKNAVTAIEDRQNTLGPLGATTVSDSITVVTSLVILGTLLGLLLAFFAGRKISKVLAKITSDMTKLADGNLDIEIEAGTQKHEVGKMTDAMAVFLENARVARDLTRDRLQETERKEEQRVEDERKREAKREEKQLREEAERNADRARMTMLESFQEDMERVMDKAASGNFSVRMSNQVDDANLAKLANLVNGQLQVTETNVADIVSSIGELAKGNLAVRIQGDKHGVFLALKEDFNASVATLSNTMSRILQSGECVSETSVELKNSSKDMSKRAEDNAATVEETSAAVEEITASIRQVVASAQAADQATQRVRQSADETRLVSTETEASINAMTDASAQINRVVKVIEDIAFQINLLALNAGVEAARA
ncbi:MAG: methyl-accepting chemotaxis protein, partial [Erythrobacter sp.]